MNTVRPATSGVALAGLLMLLLLVPPASAEFGDIQIICGVSDGLSTPRLVESYDLSCTISNAGFTDEEATITCESPTAAVTCPTAITVPGQGSADFGVAIPLSEGGVPAHTSLVVEVTWVLETQAFQSESTTQAFQSESTTWAEDVGRGCGHDPGRRGGVSQQHELETLLGPPR